MAEVKTKRPPRRTSHGPSKDPRVDSTPPPSEEQVHLSSRAPPRPSAPRIPATSRPPSESVAMRVAGLEEELDRMRAERAEEADRIADVLVRIAEAERARTDAELRIADLEEAGQTLAVQLAEARAAVEADASLDMELRAAQERCTQLEAEVERTLSQVERSERAASEAADSLDRAHSDLAAERARVVDVEAKLAKLEREKREVAKQLEQERSANARLKQQAASAEVGLRASREAAAKAARLLEELERREEMVPGVRAKSIADAKAALSGAMAPRTQPGLGAPTVEAVSLDDIDIDLPE